MKRKLASIFFLVPCVFICLSPALAADYKELLLKGDALYAQRADPAKARESVEAYRQAMAADPTKFEAAWKLSRSLYWIGREEPKEKKLAIYTEAMEAAKKGVELAPNEAPPHYWLAVVYGLYGQEKGIMQSLNLIDPIKQECQAVMKIDPAYSGGGAYMVLGRLYFKVPGLFGGSNKKAIQNLKKAIELGPDRLLNYVYLADVYIDKSMYNEAKAVLDQGLAAPCPKGLAPDCKRWKEDAQETISTLKQKMK